MLHTAKMRVNKKTSNKFTIDIPLQLYLKKKCNLILKKKGQKQSEVPDLSTKDQFFLQLDHPSSPDNRIAKPESFKKARNLTQQQEPPPPHKKKLK